MIDLPMKKHTAKKNPGRPKVAVKKVKASYTIRPEIVEMVARSAEKQGISASLLAERCLACYLNKECDNNPEQCPKNPT